MRKTNQTIEAKTEAFVLKFAEKSQRKPKELIINQQHRMMGSYFIMRSQQLDALFELISIYTNPLLAPYYYHGLTTLCDFLYSGYSIKEFMICNESCESTHNSLHPKNVDKMRIFSSVESEINAFLIESASTLSIVRPPQRADSIRKNRKPNSRYNIPANKIISTLLYFQLYDGRNIDTKVDGRLPQKRAPFSEEKYVKCIKKLLDLLTQKTQYTTYQLYYINDANKHLHFLDLFILNYFLDSITNDYTLIKIYENLHLSYSEVFTLRESLIDWIVQDEVIMSNIFSGKAYRITETLRLYVENYLTLPLKIDLQTSLNRMKSKLFLVNEPQPFFRTESYNEINKILSKSSKFADLFHSDDNDDTAKNIIRIASNYIKTNDYFATISNLQNLNNLFRYIPYESFVKYITPKDVFEKL